MFLAMQAVVDIYEYYDRCLGTGDELNVERMSALLCQDILDGLVWSESLFTKKETPSEFRDRLSKLLAKTQEDKTVSNEEIFVEIQCFVRELVLWARRDL